MVLGFASLAWLGFAGWVWLWVCACLLGSGFPALALLGFGRLVGVFGALRLFGLLPGGRATAMKHEPKQGKKKKKKRKERQKES